MIRMGTWCVHSDKDPRWNNEGRCEASTFCIPPMEAWIKECHEKYGEPPDDATKEFWKD